MAITAWLATRWRYSNYSPADTGIYRSNNRIHSAGGLNYDGKQNGKDKAITGY